MESGNSRENSVCTAFKRAQVRYRRRGNDPNRSSDLPELVDFNGAINDDDRVVHFATRRVCSTNAEEIYQGSLYGLREFPGFIYAPQALSISLQQQLAYHAVSEYCEAPHLTNIDQTPPKEFEYRNKDEKMWELWKRDCGFGDDPTVGFEEHKSNQKQPKKYYRNFQKLSWATMGYHYDWSLRCYHERAKSPMPPLVADLATFFAKTYFFVETGKIHPFTPSASIVNYYNTKSIMGGHRDDLELALDKPIVSLSLGLPAIFLLGGKSKDDTPVLPILIRPGDVLCMGGNCRLNYHGMARLLPSAVPLPSIAPSPFSTSEDQVTVEKLARLPKESEAKLSFVSVQGRRDEKALAEFLSTHRININVRQVYPDSEQ